MTSYLALRLHKVPCGSQISPIVVAYISHLTQNSPTELFGIHFSQDTPQVTRKAIMMAVDSQRKIGKNSHSKGTLATSNLVLGNVIRPRSGGHHHRSS